MLGSMIGTDSRQHAVRAVPAVPAISVAGLRKSYGTLDAVRGIDLRVLPGEIFAFLGPNGAGKTTTVEILEGFRSRSGGDVSVLGVDPARGGSAWRDRIGVVLQESQPDPGLTVRECLDLYAGYHAKPLPIDSTLALVGLEHMRDAMTDRLSGGERRRLEMALALIGDPELLFLDEPTTGFDPAARQAAWAVVERLRERGTTILLTTHYMEEAERLADRIAVIADGRIVAEGTPGTLGGRDRAASEIGFDLPRNLSPADLPPDLRARISDSRGTRVWIRSETPLAHLSLLAAWTRRLGIGIGDLEVSRPSLEDVYLRLTGMEQS
jgi:ABC-2 type transport system ATP-binding protein